jgi:hypothetical protein
MTKHTAGEANERTLADRQKHRTASHTRQMREFEKDNMTESDLALSSFDDGYDAGYARGYQVALDVAIGRFTEAAEALRTAILSTASISGHR